MAGSRFITPTPLALESAICSAHTLAKWNDSGAIAFASDILGTRVIDEWIDASSGNRNAYCLAEQSLIGQEVVASRSTLHEWTQSPRPVLIVSLTGLRCDSQPADVQIDHIASLLRSARCRVLVAAVGAIEVGDTDRLLASGLYTHGLIADRDYYLCHGYSSSLNSRRNGTGLRESPFMIIASSNRQSLITSMHTLGRRCRPLVPSYSIKAAEFVSLANNCGAGLTPQQLIEFGELQVHGK